MKTNVNTVDMAIEGAVSAAKENGQTLRGLLTKIQTESQVHINHLMDEIEKNDRTVKTLEAARKTGTGTPIQKTTTTRTTFKRVQKRGRVTVHRPARIVSAAKMKGPGEWSTLIQRALATASQPFTRKALVKTLQVSNGGRGQAAYNRAYAAVSYQLKHNNINQDSNGFIRWNPATHFQPTQAATA